MGTTGRVSIVTGAGSGMGLAIARRLGDRVFGDPAALTALLGYVRRAGKADKNTTTSASA